MTRREHARILGDVLDSLEALPRRQPERVNLAALASSANLPHDRLVDYLAELRLHGLVVGDHLPRITDRGEQFLQCYRGWIRVQALYGLMEVPGMPVETLIGFSTVGRRFAAANGGPASGPGGPAGVIVPAAGVPLPQARGSLRESAAATVRPALD
jgi:predicted transcriptional regulator